MRRWGARKITNLDAALSQGGCFSAWGVYTTLHTARFQAEDVFTRLESFDAADVPDKAALQGVVRAYGAYALLALGESFCSMAIDGASVTLEETLRLAETRFGEAMTLTRGRDEIPDDIKAAVAEGCAAVHIAIECLRDSTPAAEPVEAVA